MKLLLASLLLLAACKGDEKTAAPAKFAQPAAGPDPSALTSDCDICTEYPIVSGLVYTRYFTGCLYISHYLYFPTTDTSAPYSCSLSTNEIGWVIAKVNTYIDWQRWIAQLTYSSSGNYCRVDDSCGTEHTFYKLVPFTTGCGTYTRVYVSSADYDSIVAAVDGMTCAMCFLRMSCTFQ